jgi:hypothetical protein
MRRSLSVYHRRRCAAILVHVALCLTVVLGIAAIVLDGGMMLAQREHAQATADAAALAGAITLADNYTALTSASPDGGSSAVTDAKNVASANGFNNNGTTNTVTVNIPPTSGQFTDTTKYLGYVEVIVTWDQPRYFSGVFGSGTIPVSARAVARGKAALQPASIVVLDPTYGDAKKGGALSTGGTNSTMTVPDAIIVDSNNSSAVTTLGGGATIVSQSNISVNGGILSGSNVYAPSSGSTTNVSQNTGKSVSDPLSSLPVPSTSGLTVQSASTLNISSNTTLNPGIYQGGINITKGTVTMNQGTYYLEGGSGKNPNISLSVSGNAALTGSGVMIYNGETNGTTNNPSSVGQINLTGTITLSPPTSGTYANISIFQDRNSTTAMTVAGGSGTDITGVIYAAGAPVSISGGTNITPGVAFIADTLNISGNSNFTIPPSPINVVNPSKVDVRLVE